LVVLFQVFRDEGAHGNDPHPGVAGLGQRAAYQNAAQSTATEILTDLGVMEDALVAAVRVGGESRLLAVDCDLVSVVLRRATDRHLGRLLRHEAPFGLSSVRMTGSRVAAVRTVPGR